MFDKTLNQLYCQCFPEKIKYISGKRMNNPWISSDIMRAIKVKSSDFKLYKSGLMSRTEYTRYNNRLKNIIRLAKRNYYENKFELYRSDMKSTWKTIRSILGGKSTRGIKSIIVNGESVEDERIIADEFNNYFASVASELDNHKLLNCICCSLYVCDSCDGRRDK